MAKGNYLAEPKSAPPLNIPESENVVRVHVIDRYLPFYTYSIVIHHGWTVNEDIVDTGIGRKCG